MWAANYWGNRYFARRYWAKVGAEAVAIQRRMTDFPDRVGSRSNQPKITGVF